MENLTLCNPRPSSGGDPNRPVIVKTSLPGTIPDNHVLVQVDRFGFSANNITYQALGEAPHFRYYEFNPAPTAEGVSPATHGLIPVWGFGTVIKSTHGKIQPGERVYGYFAPTRYLLLPVSPTDLNPYSFYVPRPQLPDDRRPYNQVRRCAADPQYDPLTEDLTMIYRPLFWTSFWCEDWLYSSSYRGGARRILISSASAKTAFCLAYAIRKRLARGETEGVKIVGLTSKRNVTFTSGLKLYDEVLEYDALETMPVIRTNDKWIYVDIAGNEALNKRIFAHFPPDRLVAGIQLGLTNLSPSAPPAASDKLTKNTSLTSAPATTAQHNSLELFFLPEWLAVRGKQMTTMEITALQNQAWSELMRDGRNWITIKHVRGGDAVKTAYEEVAKGGLGPESGMIWSLWNTAGLDSKM